MWPLELLGSWVLRQILWKCYENFGIQKWSQHSTEASKAMLRHTRLFMLWDFHLKHIHVFCSHFKNVKLIQNKGRRKINQQQNHWIRCIIEDFILNQSKCLVGMSKESTADCVKIMKLRSKIDSSAAYTNPKPNSELIQVIQVTSVPFSWRSTMPGRC